MLPHLGRQDEQLALLDVGSGAGFPGMVIAIARPLWSVTLLDSMAKRVRFLDDVVTGVPITNVRTVCARAEDAGRDRAHREVYDVAVARAVSNLRHAHTRWRCAWLPLTHMQRACRAVPADGASRWHVGVRQASRCWIRGALLSSPLQPDVC